jgi:hypothetical protein
LPLKGEKDRFVFWGWGWGWGWKITTAIMISMLSDVKYLLRTMVWMSLWRNGLSNIYWCNTTIVLFLQYGKV